MIPIPEEKNLVRLPDGRRLHRDFLHEHPPRASEVSGAKAAVGEALWSFKTGNSILASPAAGPDGTIYVASNDQRLYAIGTSGRKKWEIFPVPGTASPAVGADGTIYIGGSRNEFRALRPDGTAKWIFEPQHPEPNHSYLFGSSPTLARDGAIYAIASGEYLFAINPDGTERWKFRFKPYADHLGPSNTSPVVAADGTIYFGNGWGTLFALGAEGAEKWRFEAGAPIRCTPALGHDGRIYFATHGRRDGIAMAGGVPLPGERERVVRAKKFYALNADGTPAWDFTMERGTDASPVIGTDGAIYVGSEDRFLYAFNHDGSLRWKYEARDEIASSPAICADGTILFGGKGSDHRLYALNLDGTKKWTCFAGGAIHSSPLVGADGTIYVGSLDTKLYAIKGGSPLAQTPWPAWRGTARRTGLAPENAGALVAVGRPERAVAPAPAEAEDEAAPQAAPEPETLGPPPEKLWEYAIAEKQELASRPMIAADGSVYFCAGYGRWQLYALASNGVEKWRFTPSAMQQGDSFKGGESSLSVAADGSVFVAAGSLLALDRSGAVQWQLNGKRSSGAVIDSLLGPDGTLYIAGVQQLIARTQDGTPKWEFAPRDKINGIAVAADGTVYLGSEDDRLYALGPDGKAKWHFEAGHSVGPPAIGPEGSVYVVSADKHLYAFDRAGAKKWAIDIAAPEPNRSLRQPIVGADGSIYFHDHGKLRVLRPDGTTKWEIPTRDRAHWAVASDGGVYLGSHDELFALDASGVKRWSIRVTVSDGAPVIVPVVGADGTLYVAMGNGIAAFATGTRPQLAAKPAQPPAPVSATGEGTELWKFQPGPELTSPLVHAPDGTIYFTSKAPGGHRLIAVQPDGKPRWDWTAGPFHRPLTVAGDGTIYTVRGATLVALTPDHSPKWELDIDGPPAIGSDGTLYCGIPGGQFHALRPDGTQKSTFLTGTLDVPTAPAIGADGTIYFGTRGGSFFAVTPAGKKKWELKLGVHLPVETAPALAPDGTVYFGAGKRLFAVATDGRKKWDVEAAAWHGSNIAVAPDGTIYFGPGRLSLRALRPDGSVQWEFAKGKGPTHIAVASDGLIYSGVIGTLDAINPNGVLKWRADVSYRIPYNMLNAITGLSIGADGTIYFTTRYALYAFKGSAGPAASGWPMLQHDARRSGNAAR